jgi:hypothetical protein
VWRRARLIPLAVLAAAWVGWAAVAGWAGPAAAVQTAQWGMEATGAQGGYQPEIVHPADGSTVDAQLLVWNRTSEPLTVRLSVLSVTYANQTYQYSARLSGLATGVSLPAPEVSLGPHQEAHLTVTVREPRGITTPEFAAISGESRPVQEGPLSVVERLAVLVRATPLAGAATPPAGSAGAAARSRVEHSPAGPVWLFGSIGAVLLVILVVLMERERRRRDEEVAAEVAARGLPAAAVPGGGGDRGAGR